MGGRIGIGGAAVLGTLWLTGAAQAGAPDRTQRTLDAMTRHDLCARDDAGLRRLHRDLSKPPTARAGVKR